MGGIYWEEYRQIICVPISKCSQHSHFPKIWRVSAMVRKLFVVIFATLIFSSPLMAIEPPEGATIPFEGINQAYTPAEFNEVLEAYGLMFSKDAASNVPDSYAKVDGDTVTFGDRSMAYSATEYNAILSAYGLTLTAEDVSSKLGAESSYATVKDGQVVFNKTGSWVAKPDEVKKVLSAYSKAM